MGFSAGLEVGKIDGTSALILSASLPLVIIYVMKRFPEKSARLIVASIAIAGITSGLILLRTSLQASGAPPVAFLVTLPLAYVGLNWTVRAYFGSLSRKKTMALMLASATILGALIGTSLSSIVAIAFLLALTALDVVVVESNVLPSILGKTNYSKVVSVATVPLEKYLVGLGDLLAYSILSTAALRVLGLAGAIETSILILLGVSCTFIITKKKGRAPGLLLPVALGLVPLIFGLSLL